jgi:hypothetical protein
LVEGEYGKGLSEDCIETGSKNVTKVWSKEARRHDAKGAKTRKPCNERELAVKGL